MNNRYDIIPIIPLVALLIMAIGGIYFAYLIDSRNNKITKITNEKTNDYLKNVNNKDYEILSCDMYSSDVRIGDELIKLDCRGSRCVENNYVNKRINRTLP